MEMLYEGKAKKVFKTDKDNEYLITYKDDATAFNGEKKGTINSKGVMNNKITTILFKILEKKGIETHMVKHVDDRSMLVKALEIIPIEVVVRNVAAGSLAKRLGLEEGTKLDKTVLEFYYKDDELGDPLINQYHIKTLNLATDEEVKVLADEAMKVNEILQEVFLKCGVEIIDFKLEFGRYEGKVLLGDEISPDTCRFWDVKTKEKLDKDRFRRDLGNVEEAYHEILNRLEEVYANV